MPIDRSSVFRVPGLSFSLVAFFLSLNVNSIVCLTVLTSILLYSLHFSFLSLNKWFALSALTAYFRLANTSHFREFGSRQSLIIWSFSLSLAAPFDCRHCSIEWHDKLLHTVTSHTHSARSGVWVPLIVCLSVSVVQFLAGILPYRGSACGDIIAMYAGL